MVVDGKGRESIKQHLLFIPRASKEKEREREREFAPSRVEGILVALTSKHVLEGNRPDPDDREEEDRPLSAGGLIDRDNRALTSRVASRDAVIASFLAAT